MRAKHCPVRSLLALCALHGGLLVARCANAAAVPPTEATAEQKEAAIDHFRAGKEAIESKNWALAATEFRASLALVESPNARLELARALRDSDDLPDAWDEYGRAIDSATKLLAKEVRYTKTAEAATEEQRELGAKLAFFVVTVVGAPEGSRLKVGGRVVPPEQWTKPIAALAGPVDLLLADSTGLELAHKTVDASVGQTSQVAFDVLATGGPPGRQGASLAAADDEKPEGTDQTLPRGDLAAASPSKLRPFAYVAAGIGVAGLATFGAFGVMSNSTYSNLKSACPPSTGGCPPGKQGEISAGRTEQTVANVGLVLGLLGATVGVTLFIFSIPAKSSVTSAVLLVGPEYVGIKGTL
jgi:predicted RNA-binding Zn ribbon-like protein